MQLWCAYCGNLSTAELNERHDFLWQPGGCPCDMTRWELESLELEEAAYFADLLDRTRDHLSEFVRPGIYLQARPGASTITSDLIDLGVLLFDHVVLCLDGALSAERSGVLDRVIAYADAGYLTPVALETHGALGYQKRDQSDFDEPFYDVPPQLVGRTVNFSAICRRLHPQSELGMTTLLGELACQRMHAALENEHVKDQRRAYRDTPAAVDGPVFDYALRSLLLDQLVASVMRADSVPRDSLATIARGFADLPQASDDMAVAITKVALVEWYSHSTADVPRFRSPRVVLQLKENLGTEGSLRKTVEDFVTQPKMAQRPLSDLQRAVETRLTRIVDRAQRMNGTIPRIVNVATPGVIGTVGGLLGGPLGAVVGGIGGSAVPVFYELLQSRTPAWSSYFIQ